MCVTFEREECEVWFAIAPHLGAVGFSLVSVSVRFMESHSFCHWKAKDTDIFSPLCWLYYRELNVFICTDCGKKNLAQNINITNLEWNNFWLDQAVRRCVMVLTVFKLYWILLYWRKAHNTLLVDKLGNSVSECQKQHGQLGILLTTDIFLLTTHFRYRIKFMHWLPNATNLAK